MKFYVIADYKKPNGRKAVAYAKWINGRYSFGVNDAFKLKIIPYTKESVRPLEDHEATRMLREIETKLGGQSWPFQFSWIDNWRIIPA